MRTARLSLSAVTIADSTKPAGNREDLDAIEKTSRLLLIPAVTHESLEDARLFASARSRKASSSIHGKINLPSMLGLEIRDGKP